MKLFISYRRKSWSFVYLLEEKLSKQIKGDIFVDYRGIDDTDFERSILHHLRESDVVLVVVTELTFAPNRIQDEGDWVRREIALALQLNKPIVLILVDNLPPPPAANLPADIRNVTRMQGIPFYQDYFDAAVQKLAVFVNKVVVSTILPKQDSSSTQDLLNIVPKFAPKEPKLEGTTAFVREDEQRRQRIPVNTVRLRIFISHSQIDNDFGTKLAQDLRRILGDETAVWFDAHGGLHGGDAWWSKIVQELNSRNIFIVILSPDAMNSHWVNDEINIAWRQKNSPARMNIVPLLYRRCEVRSDLTNLQMINFLPPKTYEEAFQELLMALRIMM